ncbi:TRAP transporter small permease [Roseivivax sediminis]|uniref:TRAP transporter small permease protein n=1 Tax=Roseivivax sediminis TaxID=936889 RepID=A0A1I1WRX0_9RHOB|nr:TRAP transporter small permease subunit [Roseivivax sediminis]SFD97792.1 TRAP-type C4-dicarboxylate transport system, small permease component [Roseivivax sediminis]
MIGAKRFFSGTTGRAPLPPVLSHALEVLAAGLMAIITLLVLANALGRYLFSSPLPWTEEAVISVMIWIASVGLLLGAMRGTLITCDVLVLRLPPAGRRCLEGACGIVGAAALGFFAWQIRGYLGLFGGDVSPILRLPKGLGISALMVSMAGIALVLIWRAIRAALRAVRP